MPFFLNFVLHLQQSSSDHSEHETPEGLPMRALAYGIAAVGAEVVLGLPVRLLHVRPTGTPAMGQTVLYPVMGLVSNLITSLLTIVCVVAIVLMTTSAEEPTAGAEHA